MNQTHKKYRLSHYPQIPCKPFTIESDDLGYLVKLKDVIAQQHLFLYENKVIPDYTNSITIDELIPEEYRTEEYGDELYWNIDEDEIEELLENGTTEYDVIDVDVIETVKSTVKAPKRILDTGDDAAIDTYIADRTSNNIGFEAVENREISY